MDSLILASARAVRSLFAPGMFSIMVVCVIVTIFALLGFIATTSTFFVWIAHSVHDVEASQLLPWVGGLGSGLLAWFMFPGIMPVIVTFFGDRIARIIDREDYPAAARRAQPSSFAEDLLHDIGFSLLAIALNILVLPLYLLPVINVFLFYLLNGYLLGREFFAIAARRYISARDAEILRKKNRRIILLAGAATALCATIPILNLLAPFWGIAVMAHLYHLLAKTPPSRLSSPG